MERDPGSRVPYTHFASPPLDLLRFVLRIYYISVDPTKDSPLSSNESDVYKSCTFQLCGLPTELCSVDETGSMGRKGHRTDIPKWSGVGQLNSRNDTLGRQSTRGRILLDQFKMTLGVRHRNLLESQEGR